MTKIVIDPGHGGSDPGATNGSFMEKNFNLDIALRVRDYLQQRYVADILMTRSTDTTLSLSARTNFANQQRADYFISIHINAGGGTGWESFIYNGSVSQKTIQAQNTIHQTVIDTIKPNYNVVDRGKKRANFHVLRETNMPSILLENLFIDRASDLALLRNTQFISDLSNSIGEGLAKALSLPTKQKQYKVIAGSFQNRANAESRRQLLQSKNFDAIIEEKVINGVTWYRVQAGAFSTQAAAEQRKNELINAGIADAFVIYD
jgi:N-acetylmuramoyl-L-alanine amidase